MSLIQTVKQLYLTFTEQGSAPANPDSGDQRLYIRTSDNHLVRVNSSGTVTDIEGGGITRSGSTTDAHLAVWNGSNADSLKDGGTISASIRSHMKWDDPPASAHANDDEFNGAGIDAKWGGWKSSGIPNNVAVANGLLEFDLPTGAGAAHVIYQTPPAGSWTITTKCWMNMINEDARAILFAGTSGGTVRVNILRDYTNTGNTGTSYETWTHSAVGAWSGASGIVTYNFIPQSWQWLRLAWDNANTTIYMMISLDGFNWIKLASAGSVTAPNIFGLGGLRNGAGTNQPHMKFDYFRCIGSFNQFISANGETINFTA